MTTDNKTMADVQPGGRVRLGDALRPCPFCGHSDFDQWPCEYIDASGANVVRCAHCHAAAPMKVWHDLSAQPSPGGQGDAVVRAINSKDLYQVLMDVQNGIDSPALAGMANGAIRLIDKARAELAARQPVGEPVCSGGFVIANGSGEKYMAWGQVGPEWTADRSAALWLVRRADAEALAAENEDAWSILPVERCALPPNGWACTLAAGHEGPCPTIAAPTAQAVDLGQSIPSELAPVAAALKRFGDCAEDSGSEGCDIGRDWFDALTTIGLLSRTQRSPAVWTMTAEGERLLALIDSQAVCK